MRQVTLRSPVPIANWFGPRLWLGYLPDGLMPDGLALAVFFPPAIVNLRLGLSPRLSGSLSPQRPIRHLSFWWCMCPKCHVVAFNQIFTSHWELSDLESHLYMAVCFTSSTFCYFSIMHIVFKQSIYSTYFSADSQVHKWLSPLKKKEKTKFTYLDYLKHFGLGLWRMPKKLYK